MMSKARLFSSTLMAASLLLAIAAAAEAQIASRSRNVVVVQPASLPTLAQQPGIAFQLYAGSSDGSCYLYIEQNRGDRLLILDVSDPGHVRLVKAVPLTAPGPFDFAQSLGSSAFLLRFRNNREMAVLDLRKPKMPMLKVLPDLQNPGRIESLGDSAFLAMGQHEAAPAAPQDYKIFDLSNPADPTLLSTVKQVNGRLERTETGTTFLLGSDGLTIIRLLQEEEKYISAQGFTN